MACWAIYPALHFAPIDLVAVCDLDPERARSAAQKFGAESWHTEYHKMFDEADLDAVVIQMHPRPRQQIVLDALEAGYNVLVPKPPAPDLASCHELARAARHHGVTLMVNFERRFSLAVRKARELMNGRNFAQPTQFHFSFCSGKYDQKRGRDYRNHLEAYLLDFAIHHLDLARYLGGEVEQMALFHQDLEAAASFAVALQFRSGAVGTLQLNSQRIWWRNYDRIEITGEGEYLVLDGIWSIRQYRHDENTFTENYSDERSGELTGDAYVLIEFVNAIREQRQPVASIEDAVETMRLYQAIYDAVLEGRSGVLLTTDN